MPEFTEDLILAAIAAASAIIGVMLGARLSKKTDLALKKREEKIDACADFMAAVFPALEPKHKGAAISVYNLSAGMSNFLAPAIAVVLLPWFSTIGVVIAYTALYLLAFVLCAFIRVEQPGFSSAPVTEKALNIS